MSNIISKFIEVSISGIFNGLENRINSVEEKLDKVIVNIANNKRLNISIKKLYPVANVSKKILVKIVEDSIITNKIIEFVIKNDEELYKNKLNPNSKSTIDLVEIIKLERINSINLNKIFEIISKNDNYKMRKLIFAKIYSHQNCSYKLKKKIENFQLLR